MVVTAGLRKARRDDSEVDSHGVADAALRSGRRASLRGIVERYAIVLVLGAEVTLFGVLRPNTFLTVPTLKTTLASQSTLLIVALGLLLCLAVGQFDLSFAGVLGLSFVTAGYVDAKLHWPLLVTIVAVLLIGAAAGAMNSLLIVGLGIDAVVVTLGMGTLLAGLSYALSAQTISGLSPGLSDLAGHQLLGLPLVFYYAIVLTVAVWYLLKYTPLGRYVYMTGLSRTVARLSGIRVNAITSGAFVASGILSAFAGLTLAGYLGSAAPTVADGYMLPTFAAVFLGATAIVPGRFNPWGTFFAAYTLVTGVTGLNLLGQGGWTTQVFNGASLVVAITVARLLKKTRSTS